jgi:hypothetical protein
MVMQALVVAEVVVAVALVTELSHKAVQAVALGF